MKPLMPIKPNKQKYGDYWLEIEKSIDNLWFWKIKCCNGTERVMDSYPERSLCLAKTKDFAKATGLEIRL